MTALKTTRTSTVVEEPSISVLVVSSERIFCDALIAGFRHEADLNAMSLACDGRDFSDMLTSLAPQVLVIDTPIKGATIADIVNMARTRKSKMAIVALISVSNMKNVMELISHGVTSCVLKSSSMTELIAAVRSASRESGWMSPALLPHLFVELQRAEPRAADERLTKLTIREREVLSLMVDGYDQADIAKRLYLARTTIRTHTQNLMDKLGVHSSTAAVSVALAAGVRPSA